VGHLHSARDRGLGVARVATAGESEGDGLHQLRTRLLSRLRTLSELLGKEALIKNKLAAGRDKDLVGAKALARK